MGLGKVFRCHIALLKSDSITLATKGATIARYIRSCLSHLPGHNSCKGKFSSKVMNHAQVRSSSFDSFACITQLEYHLVVRR